MGSAVSVFGFVSSGPAVVRAAHGASDPPLLCIFTCTGVGWVLCFHGLGTRFHPLPALVEMEMKADLKIQLEKFKRD